MIRAEPLTEAEAKRLNYAGVPDVGEVPGIANDGDAPFAKLAPTGEPWLKCCSECAMIDKNQVDEIEIAAARKDAAFYCIHREDESGHYRVCAGFAARDAGRDIKRAVEILRSGGTVEQIEAEIA